MFQPDVTRSTSSAEVVDARVALGEDVALEPLEPAEHLVHEPANLGELPRRRACASAATLPADRGADLLRQACLELGRGGRELLEPLPRALQHRLDLGRLGRPSAPRRGAFGRARSRPDPSAQG